MKPAAFEHHGVRTTDEATALLAEHGDDAKVLAGGQSLVPMLALRLTRFEHLVDISRVEGLAAISRDNGWVRVGAAATHRTVERDPGIAAAVPLLSQATAQVGHIQIRNRGTLGGSISHADPAAEQPAVAVALDAVMEITSARGVREVCAGDFFQSTWTTSLAGDELLTAVRFPVSKARTGYAVEEIARRHGDFALVGAVCSVTVSDGDASDVAACAIALFGVGNVPVRASAAEQALCAGAALPDVAAAAMGAIQPTGDLHATGEYRRRVAGVLVTRAVQRAIEEAASA